MKYSDGVIYPNNEVWIDGEPHNWDEAQFKTMGIELTRWSLTDSECERRVIGSVVFKIFPNKSKHRKHKFTNPFKGNY